MSAEVLLVSSNERDFIRNALRHGTRADGRSLLEMRQASIAIETHGPGGTDDIVASYPCMFFAALHRMHIPFAVLHSHFGSR